MAQPQLVGVDVTRQVQAHMQTYPISPHNRQRLAITPPGARDDAIWFIKFVPSAVEVAAEMQERYGRGFMLADQTGPLKVFYVKRADIDKAVTDVPPEVLAELKAMVSTYRRRFEGVILMYRTHAVRPIHLTSNGELRSPGDYLRLSAVRPAPVAYPDGVFSTRVRTDAGVSYTYQHETLGELGRLEVTGFGLQLRLEVQAAPGETPKLSADLFETLRAPLAEQFEATFGKPTLDSAFLKQDADTLKRCTCLLNAVCRLEMQQALNSLTAKEVEAFRALATRLMPIVGPYDADLIRSRLREVEHLQAETLTVEPVERGLYEFVQVGSEQAARELLLRQADVLLVEAAPEAWSAFWPSDPATDAHIAARKGLWERLRREAQDNGTEPTAPGHQADSQAGPGMPTIRQETIAPRDAPDSKLTLWRSVYDLAWQLFDMTPWTMLDRADLIGVEQPETGELGFVSVTDGTTFPTISVYRNARGLFGFYYSRDMPLPDYPEQYLEIPQTRVDFKDQADLETPDLELITQLGLKSHKNRLYPVFRSVQPGYRPWFLEDEEITFLACVLEQALQVLPRALLDPRLLRPSPPDRFPVRAQNIVRGEWQDTFMSIPQPGSEPILFMMDQPLLSRVKTLPHKGTDVEMDFFLLEGIPPHPSEAGQRPKYPYIFLTVDAMLGLILGHEILGPAPSVEAMWGLVGWKLVVQFDKLGFIPGTVLVRSPILSQVLASFSRQLGFTLREVEALPGVDAAKHILSRLSDSGATA